MKLNTDGSSLENLGTAGSGGVFRDEDSNWVLGYSKHIIITSSFIAELWPMRDGLSLCINRNFLAVDIELDAKAIIDVLTNPNQTNSVISTIMDDCRQLASQIPQVRFSHCFKEANRCADGLIRMGTQQSLDFILYDSPPMASGIFADFDHSGLYHNRCCPEMIVNL